MARALVLGAAAVDTIALVDAFPSADMIVAAQNVTHTAGGSTANIAVALARLGVFSAFLGCVGDDADGALIKSAFLDEGVDTAGLLTTCGTRTASVFILVNPCGERVMVALGGESIYTCPAQLNGVNYEAELLYIGEAFPDVGLMAAEGVHARGGKVAFGPGGVMCGYGTDSLLPLIAAADTMFVSRPELSLLTGENTVKSGANRLLSLGAGAVVVTEGSSGASLHTREESVFVPSERVEAVKDTTGAGDSFTAAYLYAELNGYPVERRLRFAHTCAAFTIQNIGARTSPRRGELPRFA